MAKPQASFIHKLQERLANDPVKRILLAKEYAIEDWLLGAYEQLVSRKELITVEGVSTLGLDCIVKIARVREWVLTERIRRLGGERRGGDICFGEGSPGYADHSGWKHPIITVSVEEIKDQIKKEFGI